MGQNIFTIGMEILAILIVAALLIILILPALFDFLVSLVGQSVIDAAIVLFSLFVFIGGLGACIILVGGSE